MCATVENVVEFLTDLYNKGLRYSAINTARSALSAVININGKPVGEHRLVTRFVKGIYNLRPALPKTNVTWDPEIILSYLKRLSPVNKISLKQLTLKFVTLLWLLIGQRGQSMTLIDIRNTTLSENSLKIRFGDLLKTSRPGYHQKEIVVKAYAPDRRLCVVTVAKEYLKRRQNLTSSSVHQLFLAYQKPHNAVSKSSISRWVKEVMKEAGLDVTIFTPHSVRAASTSAALRANLPIDTILSTAGWSKENTFRRYYNKPVVRPDFGTAVLKLT